MHALILGEVAACHSIWQAHWQQVRRLLEDKAGGPKSGRAKSCPFELLPKSSQLLKYGLFSQSPASSQLQAFVFWKDIVDTADPDRSRGHCRP